MTDNMTPNYFKQNRVVVEVSGDDGEFIAAVSIGDGEIWAHRVGESYGEAVTLALISLSEILFARLTESRLTATQAK